MGRKTGRDLIAQNSKNVVTRSRYFWSTFGAEPAVFFHTMSSVLVSVCFQDFIMEKICSVNLGYSHQVCAALYSNKDGSAEFSPRQEIEVQRMMGGMLTVRTILENFFPLFLIILIGAWSDKYGRKLPMLFVVGSYILQNIALLLCTYFKRSLGGWSVVMATSLIPSLSGNNACFNAAVFSYVAENAPPEKRTQRTGMVHSIMFVGGTLGLVFGGVFSRIGLGFPYIFVVGIVLEIGIFIYIFLAVENPKNKASKPLGQKITDIFQTQHITDSILVAFKSRHGNIRTKLFILLGAYFCAGASLMGEGTVFYLYSRYKFKWGAPQLSFFQIYRNVIGFVGSFVTMELLTKRWKLSDPVVGICAAISVIVATLYASCLDNGHLMFVVPILGFVSGVSGVIPRSIVSKLIPTQEIGKMSSLFGLIDSIAPLLAGPFYSMIYIRTVDEFPGTFFLISAVITIPPIIGYLYVLLPSTKKKSKKSYNFLEKYLSQNK